MKNKPFSFDAPEDSPGFLLWQTTVFWQRTIKKALDPHNISHAQFVVIAIALWWHHQEKDVTQANIVAMSKLDKMTVSKSLKKLVKMDLVATRESQRDTRAKSVRLTKSGKALATKLVPIIENIDETFFGKLPKKQEKDLILALQKLTIIEDIDRGL